MGQDEKTKPDVGVEKLGKAAEQLRKVVDEVVSKLEYIEDTGIEKVSDIADQVRELARELVAQRLEKPETEKEVHGLPVADEQLLQVAGEFSKDVKRKHSLMLGAIEILLAGADFLSCDTMNSLQEQRDSLLGGMQSQSLEDEDEGGEKTEDAVEQIPVSDGDIEDIAKRLSMWVPKKQAAIIRKIAERLPEQQREWEAETAADAARDDLLNWLLNNRSDEDRKVFYEQVFAAAKAGNGIVSLKATG